MSKRISRNNLKKKIFPPKKITFVENTRDKIIKNENYVPDTPDKVCKCRFIPETPEKDIKEETPISPIIRRSSRRTHDDLAFQSKNLGELSFQKTLFSSKKLKLVSSNVGKVPPSVQSKIDKDTYQSLEMDFPDPKQVEKTVEISTCSDKQLVSKTLSGNIGSSKCKNKWNIQVSPLVDKHEDKDNRLKGPGFAYIERTVRSKERRKQMNGYTCRECEDYYNMKLDEGFSKAEILKILNKCSKHRGAFKPPLTPERFWDADIIEGDPESPRNKTQPGSPFSTRKKRAEKRKKLFGESKN